MGCSKCKLQAEAGARIHTMVYVVHGKEQSLLGLQDAKRMEVIKMDTHGAEAEVETVPRLEKVLKKPSPKEGVGLVAKPSKRSTGTWR